MKSKQKLARPDKKVWNQNLLMSKFNLILWWETVNRFNFLMLLTERYTNVFHSHLVLLFLKFWIKNHVKWSIIYTKKSWNTSSWKRKIQNFTKLNKDFLVFSHWVINRKKYYSAFSRRKLTTIFIKYSQVTERRNFFFCSTSILVNDKNYENEFTCVITNFIYFLAHIACCKIMNFHAK